MKLVTWNTQSCTGLDGRTSAERIVQGARALADFDVLCLQEIEDNEGDAQSEAIAALLPGYRVFFGAAEDSFQDGRRRRFGNLVATRLPVLQVQHHPLPYPPDAATEAMPRMCTVVTARHPALGVVRIMTTHLEFYSKLLRLAQAQALRALHLEYFDRHGGEAIACGDFNSHPATGEHAVLVDPAQRSPLCDAWPLAHGARPHDPTFCVHEQKYLPQPVTFDYFFVTQGLARRVHRLEVDGATRASDHQPVLLELAAG